MPAEEYHRGSDGKGYVTPPGGSTAIETDINKWSLRVTGNNKDVSGTKVGRKRIPGAKDASGSVSMHWDVANKQTSTTALTGLNIRAGTIILLELSPEGATAGGTTSWRLSAIVDEVTFAGEFEGTQDYDFTFSLESGTSLKYPGDT